MKERLDLNLFNYLRCVLWGLQFIWSNSKNDDKIKENWLETKATGILAVLARLLCIADA